MFSHRSISTMQDESSRRFSRESRGHHAAGPVYFIHGAVHEISGGAAALDAVLLEKLVRRRLNRLERVLAFHGGVLVRQVSHGLVASFESAEAAIFGACEMQRRCAVIPQIADTQIALKIGIHAADSRRSSKTAHPAEAVASTLSAMLDDASIVVSADVVESLPLALRESIRLVPDRACQLPVYTVDWNAVPMLRLPALGALPVVPRLVRQAAPVPAESPAAGIVLRQGGRVLRFGCEQSVITIGRDPASDVAINSPKASRQHCRIIFHHGDYVLVDLSTNGTYLSVANGSVQMVRKNMVTLIEHGWIGFGDVSSEGEAEVFDFEIFGLPQGVQP